MLHRPNQSINIYVFDKIWNKTTNTERIGLAQKKNLKKCSSQYTKKRRDFTCESSGVYLSAHFFDDSPSPIPSSPKPIKHKRLALCAGYPGAPTLSYCLISCYWLSFFISSCFCFSNHWKIKYRLKTTLFPISITFCFSHVCVMQIVLSIWCPEMYVFFFSFVPCLKCVKHIIDKVYIHMNYSFHLKCSIRLSDLIWR